MNQPTRVAIVQSRLPRLVSPDAVWLKGLLACLRSIRERSQTLVIAPGTAGSEFVARGGARLKVEVDPLELGGDLSDPSARDERLFGVADVIFVLGLRRNGNVHKLLNQRLESRRGEVILVELDGLRPLGLTQELLAAGARLWKPDAQQIAPLTNSDAPLQLHREIDPVGTDDIISMESFPFEDEPFLTHTTRAYPGPWPEQSVEEYLDCLLERDRWADHSAFGTLSQIVRQQKLIASSRMIRGGFPVVSFTAVPLDELPHLRCFRAHRTRWDFEPYGISIRQRAMERLRAKPVIYGTEQTWSELPEIHRPRFQLSGTSESDGGTQSIDWSVEQEWRHMGDLDLSSLEPEDIRVFVPTQADALALQPICPWPITYWPGS